MAGTPFNASRLTGYLMILASAICFGSYGIWSKLLGDTYGVFTQGWEKTALVLLVLIPLGIATKSFRRIDREDWRPFAIITFFTIFTIVPIYYAFIHLSLGTATLLFYGFFLLTTYGTGWLVMKEKLTAIKIVAFVLAIVGLLLTFGFSLAVFAVGAMLLAAFNGVASGAEVTLSKWVTNKYSTIQVTTVSWAAIFVTHLAAALIAGEPAVGLHFDTPTFALVMYATTGLAGFWLVVEGFRHVDASVGGLIGLSEILFSVGFGLLFFSEHLTLSVVAGGVCILLAGILPDVAALRHRTKPAPLPSPL